MNSSLAVRAFGKQAQHANIPHSQDLNKLAVLLRQLLALAPEHVSDHQAKFAPVISQQKRLEAVVWEGWQPLNLSAVRLGRGVAVLAERTLLQSCSAFTHQLKWFPNFSEKNVLRHLMLCRWNLLHTFQTFCMLLDFLLASPLWGRNLSGLSDSPLSWKRGFARSFVADSLMVTDGARWRAVPPSLHLHSSFPHVEGLCVYVKKLE